MTLISSGPPNLSAGWFHVPRQRARRVGEHMSKIVIVGANHAGTVAANAILDNHPGNEVVIIDQNGNNSFLGCDMALWIGA